MGEKEEGVEAHLWEVLGREEMVCGGGSTYSGGRRWSAWWRQRSGEIWWRGSGRGGSEQQGEGAGKVGLGRDVAEGRLRVRAGAAVMELVSGGTPVGIRRV